MGGKGREPEKPAVDTATLDYIRSMLRELRHLAEKQKAEMLIYFIEMAYEEVNDLLSRAAEGQSHDHGSRSSDT